MTPMHEIPLGEGGGDGGGAEFYVCVSLQD